jgi:hypothetical protein
VAEYTITIEPKAPQGEGCGGCLALIYAVGFLLTFGMWCLGASSYAPKEVFGGLLVSAFWPLIWAYAILTGLL